MRICLDLDYWSDDIGTFDPRKVINLVKRRFPETVIDAVDYQEVERNKLLELCSQVSDDVRRQVLRGQIIRNDQDNGPKFKFEIPTETGQAIKGTARRYSISLEVPESTTESTKDSLVAFLEVLCLGAPQLKFFPPRGPTCEDNKGA